MAQPTDNASRFEVSEPSEALPVPALSRYARPRPEAADDAKADASNTGTEPSADPRSEAPTSNPERRRLDPIVEAASEEWATDPSPPQDVNEARPKAAPLATPAVRPDPAAPVEEGKRRPFWKRLSMVRPQAEPAPPPPSVEIPKDLLKPAIERIDHLTRRFEREQKALHERLEEFEHNLTRLWELEEQMGLEEVRAQLAVMRANQEETADALHTLARRITIGAGAIVAVFGALLVWLLI